MVEAGGVGILSLIDITQLIDFIRSQKHQKLQIRRSEVHGGCTELRAIRGVGIHMRKRCTRTPFLDNFRFADNAELTQRQGQAYIQRSESRRSAEESLHLGTRAAVDQVL
jgi:hypothetical protein